MELVLYSVDMVVMTPDQTFQTVQTTNMNSDRILKLVYMAITASHHHLKAKGQVGYVLFFSRSRGNTYCMH